MEDLLNKLNGELCVAGIKKKHLATAWGVSPSVVTDVFKQRIMISFCCLVKTLQMLKKSEKSKEQTIAKYLEHAKLENLNEAMEFLALQGDFNTLHSVIEKVKNKGNKEWSEVYALLLERYTLKPEENKSLFKKAKETSKKLKSLEMKTLIEILLLQTVFQSGNYHLLSKHLSEIKADISKVTNKYIKYTFEIRLNEAAAVISLQSGDVKTTRTACLKVFKAYELDPAFSIPYIVALGKMGESFFFEDYCMAINYLEEAMQKIDDLHECEWSIDKKKKIVDTINFLKIHHWRDVDGLESVLEGTDLAYFKVKQGKCEEAEEILLTLEKEKGSLNEIATFVLALARGNDVELLKESLRMCEEKANIFYSYLPKKHLGLS